MKQTNTGHSRLGQADGEWELVLERMLAHPIEDVWAALTESGQLLAWAPFATDRDLTTAGPVRLAHLNNPEEDVQRQGNVLTVDAPRLLVFRWGSDVLRWELITSNGSTVLTLHHRFADRQMAPSYAAGWHLCLRGLTGILAGQPMPSMTGSNAFRYGWKELYDQYAKQFEANSEHRTPQAEE